MPADPSIYSQFAPQPVSINDVLRANVQNQLAQNQLANIPLQNQLLQTQVAQAQLANQKQQQMMDVLQQVMGGPTVQNGLSGQPQSAGSPIGSSANGLQQGTGAPAGMPGLTLPLVGYMKAAGGPDLMDVFKAGMQGFDHPAGGYVTDAQGNQHYNPKPGEATFDSQGRVVLPQGTTEAVGALAAAQEGAKANLTPLPLGYVDAGSGRPVGGSVGGYLGVPQPGAPAQVPARGNGLPSPLDSLPADQRAQVLQDMAKTGLSPTQATINGQPATKPMPWDALQAEVDAAKQKGPAGIAQLQMKYLPMVMSIKDPAQQAKALGFFNNALQSDPGTPVRGGTPQLAGPAQLAGATKQAESNVQATMDPLIAFRKDLLTGAQTSNQKAMSDLSDITNNESEIVARNNRIGPLIAQLPNIGGFSQEARIDIANKLKNSGIISDDLANKIAGGDVTAAKTVENQLSAAGIQTMIDTLNKEGKPNRAIFQQVNAQKEGLDAGRPVLQNIINLQQQLYDQHRQQLGTMTNLMTAPDYNPLTFANQFATQKAQQIAAPQPISAKTVDFRTLK